MYKSKGGTLLEAYFRNLLAVVSSLVSFHFSA